MGSGRKVTIKVAVSGINAVDNPGPGIGIIKGLKEGGLPVSVVGLAYDAMEPGVYLPELVDRAYLMPYPSEGEVPFLDRLLYIKEKEGLEAVIPALDAEMPLFIDLEPRLSTYGMRTFLPTKEQFRLRAKDRLPAVAETIGIRTPRTLVVTSHDEFSRALSQLEFPVMVKGLFYKALKAHTSAEAEQYFHRILAEWGFPVILQEVVVGEEMNVVGVGDGEGGHFGLVAIKKLWITSLGKIWTGVTVTHQRLLSAAEEFVRSFRWRGAFELETIVKDEDIYLIEINPRFPAWIYFAVGVGVNFPARLLKAALGEEPERESRYEAGKLYIRFTDDLVTDIRIFQHMVTRGER